MSRMLAQILCLFLTGSAWCTVFLPIDTTVLQKATLSWIHQNRILVDGGRIIKVIYPDDGSIAISIEEESGQAFIHTTIPNPQTITISVVTNLAMVQDIEIDFANCSSEVIVLTLPHEDMCCPSAEPCIVQAEHDPDAIQYKINSLLSGKVPQGYTSCQIKGPVRMLKKRIRGENIARITSLTEDLYIWRLENRSRFKAETILEKELGFIGSKWIYLQKNCLNPRESITAIVAVQK
jgi:TraK protein